MSDVVFATPSIIFAVLRCTFSSGSKTPGEHVPQTDIPYVAFGNSPLKSILSFTDVERRFIRFRIFSLLLRFLLTLCICAFQLKVLSTVISKHSDWVTNFT